MTKTLFAINPALDRPALAARFAAKRRVQVRDVLTSEAARTLRGVLERETPWGFAYKGAGEPTRLTEDQVRSLSAEARREIANDVQQTAASRGYAVRFNQYPILDAYLAQRQPGGPHDILLEHLNDAPFLDLAREVTRIPELRKADAQATLFAPGDFLSLHNDSHKVEGWRVAYVLNLADDDWSPDWGGYLNFFDEDGDIVAGWRPRFNVLNLFAVPQPHHVSYVPPFAGRSRLAITGWLRDR
jgi:Rps23 Pro-64 3,4-dihydroxylase Tpa1-like proline 4-hydroxylase